MAGDDPIIGGLNEYNGVHFSNVRERAEVWKKAHELAQRALPGDYRINDDCSVGLQPPFKEPFEVRVNISKSSRHLSGIDLVTLTESEARAVAEYILSILGPKPNA